MDGHSSSTRENLVIDASPPKTYFQHSWWRIALIILTVLAFIATCTFSGFATTGSNSVFNRTTGNVSDRNQIEITPAGWTFSIWGLIYFWQAAWLLYALSRIPRTSDAGYLYIIPDTLHYMVFVLFTINLIFNIVWLFLWERSEFGWSTFVNIIMLLGVAIPLIITHVLLQHNRPIYIRSNRIWDIWLVRALVHNGLALYTTWLFIATLLNLTIWMITKADITSKAATNQNASTLTLGLILIGIIIYFVCENILYYSAMAYTFTPWFVLIFGLFGIVSQNYKRVGVSERNQSFALALMVICCILAIVRLFLFVTRYNKRQIPTIRDP